MKTNTVDFNSKWWGIPMKYLLNDNEREQLVTQWDINDEQTKKDIERLTPWWEWINNNNPCPSCTINKKDYWDDVHYNCKFCHAHSCDILKEFEAKRDDKRKTLIKD
jgi:hypothetical protein